MLLEHLLAALPSTDIHGDTACTVSAVEYDSRSVSPGAMFVAVPGFDVDGHAFLQAARARGACAVVVESGRASQPAEWDVASCAWVAVPDTRVALSALAAAWFGHPAAAMRMIGVTGTDGKTTTSSMIAALLEGDGRHTGLASTARFKIGDGWEENSSRQTTLEPVELHALLARMRDAGVSDAVVETSSHGLALHKVDDCLFDAGVYTTVTEDHLDFHRTRAAYWEAKARLLDLLARPSPKDRTPFAVLNADDGAFDYFRERAAVPTFNYALNGSADLTGKIVAAGATGSRVRLAGRWGTAETWVPMAGAFNAANALAALCVAAGTGIPLTVAAERLERFDGVPGRMERVDRGQPFTLLIDYAHTAFALRKLLTVLRPLTPGRIIVVFGSAGEQSHERRPGMGQVAAELADYAVLTSEDPRREPPEQIVDDIATAIIQAGRVEGSDFARVVDRAEAISLACSIARTGDTVVLAGKGHERSILVGDTRVPWNEREQAERALRGWAASSGDDEG